MVLDKKYHRHLNMYKKVVILTAALFLGSASIEALSNQNIGTDLNTGKTTNKQKAPTAAELAAAKAAAKEAADKVAADKVAADKIAADKIAADKVAADKIAADKIAADKIAADKIAADKIAADKIAADKIAADKIAADKVAADKVAADKIAADKIAADKVVADKVAADKVAADKVAAFKEAADKVATTTTTSPVPQTPIAPATVMPTTQQFSFNSVGTMNFIFTSGLQIMNAMTRTQNLQASQATQFGASPPPEMMAFFESQWATMFPGVPFPGSGAPPMPFALRNSGGIGSLESGLKYLSDESSGPITLSPKDKPYQVFVCPYYTKTYTKPTSQDGVKSATRQYGATLGGMAHCSSIDSTLGITFGTARSKTQNGSNPLNYSKMGNLNASLYFSKQFFDRNLEYSAGLSLMRMSNSQSRVGTDLLNQTDYTATAKYKTYAVSFNNEVGHSFLFKDVGFTIRPSLAVQVSINHRPSYQEEGGGTNNNQSYKKRNKWQGEATPTLAFTKKWQKSGIEGGLTVSYGFGRQSGNGKSSDKVYTNGSTDGITSSGKTTGRNTQYINVLGEISQKDGCWAINPGGFFAIQNKMKSSTGSMKFTYKW